MSDFSRPGIRAAKNGSVFENNPSADTGRKRHVKKRTGTSAGAVIGFAERADVGVVIHDDGRVEKLAETLDQWKIAPAADVRRECYALALEFDRPSETDSAAFKRTPWMDDGSDLVKHPVRTARTVGDSRLAARHTFVVKQRDAKLGPADVDGERGHALAKTSSGEAVPVPFFMMVMEATRLPNRAAL